MAPCLGAGTESQPVFPECCSYWEQPGASRGRATFATNLGSPRLLSSASSSTLFLVGMAAVGRRPFFPPERSSRVCTCVYVDGKRKGMKANTRRYTRTHTNTLLEGNRARRASVFVFCQDIMTLDVSQCQTPPRPILRLFRMPLLRNDLDVVFGRGLRCLQTSFLWWGLFLSGSVSPGRLSRPT